MNPAERKFKNDFCDYVKNKWLSTEMLIGMLKIGFPLDQMPEEARKAVTEELRFRKLQESLK